MSQRSGDPKGIQPLLIIVAHFRQLRSTRRASQVSSGAYSEPAAEVWLPGILGPCSPDRGHPRHSPGKTTQRQFERGEWGCNAKGKDAISDQNCASGTSQGRGILGDRGEKWDGYPDTQLSGGSQRCCILVETSPDTGRWCQHTEPMPATMKQPLLKCFF